MPRVKCNIPVPSHKACNYCKQAMGTGAQGSHPDTNSAKDACRRRLQQERSSSTLPASRDIQGKRHR